MDMKRILTFAVILVGFTGMSYGAAFDYDYLPNGYKYVKHTITKMMKLVIA